MPRVPKSPGLSQRHNPLADDYLPADPAAHKVKRSKRTKRDDDDDAAADHAYVDAKSSRRILDIGRELEEEDARESQRGAPKPANPAFDFDTRLGEDLNEHVEGQFDDDENDDDAWGEDEEDVEEVEIDANDLAAWNKFIPTDDNPIQWPGAESAPTGPGTDLAALILEKIAAHEGRTADGDNGPRDIVGGGAPEDAVELPAKVVEVYSKVGLILSRYKAGKLPKPFKILPTIPAWETLVAITRPDNWTPNSMYAATRIFVSSKPFTAQLFLNTVLLPAVQSNIAETGKLNIHLYNALKKALYKPSAFFKGLVFPLLTDSRCTHREATIIASVVAKVSVPVLHSAAALHRLCEIAADQMSSDPDAAGPCNIFIKTLLEKKYALPYKVIDALVFHFLRFRATSTADAMDTEALPTADVNTPAKLPVIWHQCLLAFAQRYRNDITEDQREALLDLLLSRGHKAISPEVRRELLEGRGRGVVAEPAAAVALGGDDTMVMG